MTREEATLILQMWWNWHNGKMPVYPVPTEKFNEAFEMAIEELKDERQHGEWIIRRDKRGAHIYSVCSRCNVAYLDTDFPNFCPNCGADMRPKIHGCSFASEECAKNPCADCGLKEGEAREE